MSTDLRIAILTVGAILLAAAVVTSLLRMANRGSALAGAGPRLLMGLAGAALVAWGLVGTHLRRAANPPASVATTAASPEASAQPTGSAAAASAGAAANVPAPANASAPATAPSGPDVIVLAGSAFDGCAAPKQPGAPPDGATATRAQMIASDTQTQAFNTATNAYLACLDKAANDFDRQYGRILSGNGLREVEAMHTRIHNAAVDTDQAVADKFNQQLRIYKARGRTS